MPRKRQVAIDDLLLWLALDTHHGPEARRERVAQAFGLQRQPSDALHAARFTLAQAMVDPHAFSPEVADQITAALKVLHANGQAAQSAMCWRWLARHAWRGNAIDHAVHWAQRALACKEAPVEFKLSLVELLLPGLTQLLRFEEAEGLLQREFLPLLVGASPGLAVALAWAAVAFYRLECALRAGNIESEVTRDMDGLLPCISPAALARMRPFIEQARRELQLAREAGGSEVEPAVRLAEAVIAAFEGDLEAAFSALGHQVLPGASARLLQHNRACFLRLNGRWQEAIDILMPQGKPVPVPENLRVERANCLELAICAAAVGQWELAYVQERRYRQLAATASRHQGRSAAFGLEDATPPAVDPLPNQDVRLRRTLPAHVRRAIPLFEDTLSNRMTLAEMAARVGVRERTLQEGLRRYLDSSYVAMYRASAMRVAAELLRLQSLPVTEVASRVGYQSLTSFSREFRVFHGRTPTDYRRAALASDA